METAENYTEQEDHPVLSAIQTADTRNKLKPIHKIFLVQRLKEFDSLSEAAEALKAEFNISISIQTVQFYYKKHKLEIDQARLESTKQLFTFPLAHKFYRLKRLTNMLHNLDKCLLMPADIKRLELQILAQARAEIGEDIEKLADALRESGHRSYHFDFSSHSEADRARLLGETAAAVFGVGGGANRM